MFFIGQKVKVAERHSYTTKETMPAFDGVVIEENRGPHGSGIAGLYVMVISGQNIGMVHHCGLQDIVFSNPKELQSKLEGSDNGNVMVNLLGALMGPPPNNGYQ